MNRWHLAVATMMIAGFCVPFHAQAPDTPVFRAGTILVEFTFVAVDGNGRPVTDLSQDEIDLREDGKPRDIAFFRFEGKPAIDRGETRPLPTGLFTNRIEYTSGPPRNITVILVDALNTPPTDQQSVRRQLMAYLETVTADTRVAVYGLGANGITVMRNFTGDVASLRAGMDEGWRTFPVQAMPDVQEIQCYVGRFLGWPEDVTTCQLPRTPLDWELFGAETLAFQASASFCRWCPRTCTFVASRAACRPISKSPSPSGCRTVTRASVSARAASSFLMRRPTGHPLWPVSTNSGT